MNSQNYVLLPCKTSCQIFMSMIETIKAQLIYCNCCVHRKRSQTTKIIRPGINWIDFPMQVCNLFGCLLAVAYQRLLIKHNGCNLNRFQQCEFSHFTRKYGTYLPTCFFGSYTFIDFWDFSNLQVYLVFTVIQQCSAQKGVKLADFVGENESLQVRHLQML